MLIPDVFDTTICSLDKKNDDDTCLSETDVSDLLTSIGFEASDDFEKNIEFLKIRNAGRHEPDWYDLNDTRNPVAKRILEENYLPIGPPNNEWLSNKDIDDVMRQVQKLVPDFQFAGTFAANEMKQDHIDKNKEMIGIVLNTSPVNVDGMHWVSILIDNKMKSIEFFDPVGNPYKKNPYFKQTMSMIQNIFPKHSVIVNKQQHQMKNGQCGVYSLFYIIMRAMSVKSMSGFNKTYISDEMMKEFRKRLFRFKK
jgi:hypothetical protein